MRNPLTRELAGGVLLGVVLLATACSKPPPCSNSRQLASALDKGEITSADTVLYVLGDWGTAEPVQFQVAEALRRDVQQLPLLPVAPVILGVGDLVYPDGLEHGWAQEINKTRMENTFGNVYRNLKYNGQPVPFHTVAGNHDHRGDVLLYESEVEARYSGADPEAPVWHFYPVENVVPDTNDQAEYQSLKDQGGKKLFTAQRVDIDSTTAAIVALDTQYLIELYDRDELDTANQIWQKAAAEFANTNQPWRIIIGHHPIVSHSHHGRPISTWERTKRTFTGFSLQRLTSPQYQAFAKDLEKFMKANAVQFYLAGHDHSLQMLDLGTGSYQIISGVAGEPGEHTRSCDDTLFSSDTPGFVRMDVTADTVAVSFHMVSGEHSSLLVKKPK